MRRVAPSKSLRKLRSPRCQKTVPPPGCPPPGRSAAFRSHPPLWRASHTSWFRAAPLSVDLLHGGAGVQDKHEISLPGPAHRPPESPLGLSSCLRRSLPPWSAVWSRAQSVLLTQVTVLPCVVGGPQRRIPAVLVEAELTVHCSLHQVPYRVVLEKYIAVFQLFQDTRLGPLTDCTPIRHPW